MKKKRKLRHYISLWLGLISLVMIVAYTMLVVYSIFAGIDDTAGYELHLAARDFEILYKKDPKTPLPTAPRMTAYMGEKNLPTWFKDNFAPEILDHAELIMEEMDDSQNQYFTFLAFPYDLYDGQRLYLIKIFTQADDLPEAFTRSDRAGFLILILGIGFILCIILMVQFLFRKVSGSVEILSLWAATLNQENLEKQRPDFKFHEIDQLADLIQNSVDNLHQALTREHQFLRNSSHELRTPIAILRSNMDLLERLRPNPNDQEKAIYQRMRRGVDNMHRLTETLLWLSRKEEKMPQPQPVLINALVDELVQENKYLLTGKEVDLTLDTVVVSVTLPLAACRIALSNLIRNAFQYTGRGKVKIQVSATQVLVINQNRELEEIPEQGDDYGFGLGLMLVEQISQKIGLHYENQPIAGGHRAVLSFNPAEQ